MDIPVEVFTGIWVTLGVIGGITEIAALLNKREGAPLSNHVWRWWHVLDPRPTRAVWAGRVVLLTIMIWLTGHLSFGWWSFDVWPF